MNTACLVFAWHAAQTARVGCAVCLGGWGLWRLGRIGPRLQATTAWGAWCWALLAWGAVSLVECLAAWAPPEGLDSLRYVAAALTVCPIVALLGAKRPQHRVWHWIVLSLWIVLALPAPQAWIRGQAFISLGSLRTVLVFALVVIGCGNGLATRHAGAAIAAALAQAALFAPHLGIMALEPGTWPAQACSVAGWLLAGGALVLAGDYGLPARPPVEPWQQVWRDFRDVFGWFWSLRLVERFNLDAQRNQWSFRLALDGLYDGETEGAGLLDQSPPEVVRQNIENLLRRFVDSDWLHQRWPPVAEPPVASPRGASTNHRPR